MQEFVTLDVLLNWVLMLRANIDGAILLADDEEEARFYERLLHPSAQVIPAFSVAGPLLDRLTQLGIQGIAATARGLPKSPNLNANVFCPTLGDLASLFLASKDCQRVLIDVCGTPWITACEKEVGPIVSKVVSLARLFNQVRHIFEIEVSQPLTIQSFVRAIDWQTLQFGVEELQSIYGGVTPSSQAIACIESFSTKAINTGLLDDLQECDGMDAVYILAAATHFFVPRGIAPFRKVEGTELVGLLRIGFELEEIEDDELFWQMNKWERENGKYPLLNDWRSLDSLEVVWDQRYWERDLKGYLRMSPSDWQMALIKMDLDNFKQVNENLGHTAGDDAIRLFCRIVKYVVGQRGYVYRRGGDEVVSLLPNVTSRLAQDIAERIRAEAELRFREWADERGLATSPTASIGLVLSGGSQAEQIISRMDQAQQQAKENGKNQVVVLDDIT